MVFNEQQLLLGISEQSRADSPPGSGPRSTRACTEINGARSDSLSNPTAAVHQSVGAPLVI